MRAGLGRKAKFMALSSYLRLFHQKLSEAFRRLFDKHPAPPAELSTLCRFIFQSNHFSGKQAKPGAFLPAPNRLRISMFFVDSLQSDEIWRLGDLAGANRQKPAKARAELDKGAVLCIEVCKLRIEADPQPHARHVNIAGWPAEKETQKAVALELCAAST